jgi:hypothetical protein
LHGWFLIQTFYHGLKRTSREHVDAAAGGALLTVKFREPSHEFTFGIGMTFISYPLVLTPLV